MGLTSQIAWWDAISKVEEHKGELQEDVAQAYKETNASKPEGRWNKGQENVVPTKYRVLTKAERKEKLVALTAELKLMNNTKEEEAWQHAIWAT